jgi:hypothetical protein
MHLLALIQNAPAGRWSLHEAYVSLTWHLARQRLSTWSVAKAATVHNSFDKDKALWQDTTPPAELRLSANTFIVPK